MPRLSRDHHVSFDMPRQELLSRLLDGSRRAGSIKLLDARRHVWDEAQAVGRVGALQDPCRLIRL